MSEAHVVVSRKCQNRCVFCAAAPLDGSVVPKDEVLAAIDAAADAGHDRVILTGGEATLSPALLAAIKHAKARGLEVALTTNGRIVQSEKVARMLEATGLDEIRVSVHSGRRSTHDGLARSKNAWVDGLAGLRFAGRTGMRVILRSVVTKHNDAEIAHLMHLGCMAGVAGHEVIRVAPEGPLTDPAKYAELALEDRLGLRLVSNLWFEAKEEQVLFTQVGWEHTRDLGHTNEAESKQADIAALKLLRQRFALSQADPGLLAIDEFGMAKDFKMLVDAHGGVAAVGLELAAHAAPLVDMPWCVGGRPTIPADHWGDAVLRGEGCGDCAAKGCPGAPRKLKKVLGDSLAPLPHWSGLQGVGAVVGGEGALMTEHVVPDLRAALAAEGLTIQDDVAGTDWVVAADAATARRVREAGGPETVVVLDSALGGLTGLDARVVSWVPGRVDTLVGEGVDLRRVHFRAFPAPAVAGADTSRPIDATRVVALGETADWRMFERAVVSCTGKLPKVHVFADGVTETGQIVVHEPDEAAILEAILGARVVVFPLARPGVDDAASRAALARDLRWMSVATAAGRPILAVRAPGTEDHVRHDATGWLSPAGDVQQLSTALRRLVNEPVRLNRYHAGARKLAASYTVGAFAKQLAHGHRPWDDALVKVRLRPWPVW